MDPKLAFKGFSIGVLSGVLLGIIGIIVNTITSAFPFEMNIVMLLVTFSIGGAIFGVVVGGLMAVTDSLFLIDRPVIRAVALSAGFWAILRLVGSALTMADHERYHPVMVQSIQGLVLAIALGVIFGLIWKTKTIEDVFAG